MKLKPGWQDGKSPAEIAQVECLLAELETIRQEDPLQFFRPHSEAQREFLVALTAIIAAFAGNRFGKTTSLVIKSLAQVLPVEMLPPLLREYKRFEAPAQGWIVVPTTDKIYDSLLPTFRRWTPAAALLGGSWDKAWSKERRQITFACGSHISFKTYEQDPSTLGGAALHFVGYDEPPPLATREECMTRLIDFGGFEMFAMTPLKTNTGWIRREIFKNREAPYVTVIRGSMHDNPTLNEDTKTLLLSQYSSDLWRQAREFGDFVDVGGQIYPEFDRSVAKKPWAPEFVQSLDVVVGVDPGIRNAGIVFCGFDGENVAHVFDELLLQDKTPADYAKAIRSTLQRWGVPEGRVLFVIDPAARQRNQTNAQTVMTLMSEEGIPCLPGQNDVDAGIAQLRTRMAHGRFLVSPDCRGLRDEADDYAAEEPKEGRDDSHLVPIKGHDHRLDALRYACMERLFDPILEQQAPGKTLGWEPGRALSATDLRGMTPQSADVPPMSSFS